MSSPDVQISKGREALLYFHNDSVIYPGYGLTFDDLLNKVSRGKPTVFLEGFGFAIEQMDGGTFFSFGMNKVKSSMQSLALASQGRIPTQGSFFKALSDEGQKISYIDAAGFVGVETAKTVGTGLVAGGETLITTLKGLNFLFPLIVIGGVLFISWSRIKKLS